MSNNNIQTRELQSQISPTEALQMLKDGNERFLTGKKMHRELLEQAKGTAKRQYPFAAVLSCVDSRVVPEYIFDQGIGDIVDIRIAGNIINEDIIGSLEFACKLAGAKLILVLGHTNCAAIIGAIDNIELGSLSHLVEKIKLAENNVGYSGIKRSDNSEYLDLVTVENIKHSISEIKLNSPVLKGMIENNDILLTGAKYYLETGKVEFY